MNHQTKKSAPLNATALEAWHKRLDTKRGTAIEAVLAFAGECYAFREDCERKKGGSTYSEKMLAWFGINQSTASMWSVVGEHRAKLIGHGQLLPTSVDTLYQLCELPDKTIRRQVTPKTTRREATDLKKAHALQGENTTATFSAPVLYDDAGKPPGPDSTRRHKKNIRPEFLEAFDRRMETALRHSKKAEEVRVARERGYQPGDVTAARILEELAELRPQHLTDPRKIAFALRREAQRLCPKVDVEAEDATLH